MSNVFTYLQDFRSSVTSTVVYGKWCVSFTLDCASKSLKTRSIYDICWKNSYQVSSGPDYACNMKHHLPYTTVLVTLERKYLHESENNWHEIEMVPTTNSILTQRQVGCW